MARRLLHCAAGLRTFAIGVSRSHILQSLLGTRPNVCSSFYRQHGKLAYKRDGKMKVSILKTEAEHGLMVVSYSQLGFRLNNDMVIVGPMAIFPKSILSWNVNSYNDINEDSLSLFYTLDPKIDVLVIGIGDQQVTPAFSKRIMEFMKQYKINVEVLKTEQACVTFNFLNAENRMVAAALIPPLQYEYNENDLLQSKLRKKALYELD